MPFGSLLGAEHLKGATMLSKDRGKGGGGDGSVGRRFNEVRQDFSHKHRPIPTSLPLLDQHRLQYACTRLHQRCGLPYCLVMSSKRYLNFHL